MTTASFPATWQPAITSDTLWTTPGGAAFKPRGIPSAELVYREASTPPLNAMSNCNSSTPWLREGEVAVDREDVLLECADMSHVRTVLDCGVIPVVALLGVAGNALCVVVFLRQRYQSVAKPLLLALCVSDLLLLLAAFLTSLPCMEKRVKGAESGRELQAVMTPQLVVFRDIMSRVTVFLTLAIGVERCVAVTRPFKLRAVCTVPRTRTAVFLVFLVLFSLQAPAFFMHDVSHHVTPPHNVTKVTLHETQFYRENRRVLDFYFNYFLLVMLRGLPVVALLVCFAIILICLKRRLQSACPKTPKFGAFANARHRQRGSGEAADTAEHGDLMLEERKLTRALLLLVLLCLVSEIPGLAAEMYHVVRPKEQLSSGIVVTRDVCRLLCVLYSALPFPLFIVMYKHFAVTCKALTGGCTTKEHIGTTT